MEFLFSWHPETLPHNYMNIEDELIISAENPPPFFAKTARNKVGSRKRKIKKKKKKRKGKDLFAS